MRFGASVTLLLLFVAAVVLTLFASGKTTEPVNADGYSHGTMSCLQGIDGSGVRLRLRQRRHCDGEGSDPYLKIDIRELPVQVNTRITVGDISSAFKCRSPKGSCEQFRSGAVIFNHFEEINGKELQTEGWYELRFTTGLPETGRFKVDCYEPCA